MKKKIKHAVKRVCPPVLMDFITRNFFKETNVLVYSPKGFAAQLPTETSTWEASSVRAAHEKKWSMFLKATESKEPLGFIYEFDDFLNRMDVTAHNLNMTFAFVICKTALEKLLHSSSNKKLKILDWGGGMAHHFQLAEIFLPREITIDFHCKEIKAMADLGRRLNSKVQWLDGDDCFIENQFDLVMLDGALQCIEDWRSIIAGAAKATNKYFFLTRTPVVSDVPGYAAIQHIYDASLFHQQFNEVEINECFKQNGLKVVHEFATFDGPPFHHAPEQPKFKGWLLEKI